MKSDFLRSVSIERESAWASIERRSSAWSFQDPDVEEHDGVIPSDPESLFERRQPFRILTASDASRENAFRDRLF